VVLHAGKVLQPSESGGPVKQQRNLEEPDHLTELTLGDEQTGADPPLDLITRCPALHEVDLPATFSQIKLRALETFGSVPSRRYREPDRIGLASSTEWKRPSGGRPRFSFHKDPETPQFWAAIDSRFDSARYKN